MKIVSKIFLAISLFMSAFALSQMTMHKLVNVGYVYQNQSFGELGGKLLFLNNDDVVYRLGASALMGSTNGEFAIMPKVQGDILLNFERNVDFFHSYYFLAGAEVTTKYAAPKIGINILGMLDITGGYAFSLDKKGLNGKELKGFNFNFTLNIPTVMIHDLLSK